MKAIKFIGIIKLLILLFTLSNHAEEFNFQELIDSTLFYQENQNYQTSLQWAFRAEAKAKEQFAEMDTNYVAAVTSIYYCYYFLGNYNKAIEYCEKARHITKALLGEKSLEYTKVLNNLGLLYVSKGLYSEAEPLYKEVIKVENELMGENRSDYATSLNNLAELYRQMGRYSEAEPLYKRAMMIDEEQMGESNTDYAISLNNLAELYRQMGRYSEAEPLFKKSIKIVKELLGEIHTDHATSLNNLALLYLNMGRYSEAEPLYEETTKIWKEIFGENHPSYATSLNNLGITYYSTGKYNEAERIYKEAVEIWKEKMGKSHPDYATSLNNLAELFRQIGRYSEAEPLLLEAVQIRKELMGETHPNYAFSLFNLVTLYTYMGRYSEAEPLIKTVIAIRKEQLGENHPDYARALFNLTGIYEALGRYSEAEPLFKEAVERYINIFSEQSLYLSEQEKEKFWNTMKGRFEAFNSFAKKINKSSPDITMQIYDNLLFTKGLLLASTMKVKNSILSSGNEELIGKYENWIWQKKNLSKYYSMTKDEIKKKRINLDSIEQSANNREKELSMLSGDFAKLTGKRKYKWQDVQKSLKPGEVSIEITRYRYQNVRYLTDTIHYSVLIIKPDSKYPDLLVLENGNNLEGKYIELYRNQIERQKKSQIDPGIITSTSKELYTQYWHPIAEKLEGVKKVYISLDGVYNQFNLNTLVNPKTGKYLIEEMNIVQLTSTRDLIDQQVRLAENQKTIKRTALLFGDPEYDLKLDEYLQLASDYNIAQDYSNISRAIKQTEITRVVPLPGTRTEVEAISKELVRKKWDVKKFLGGEALEDALKVVKNPTVLHIATHGKFLRDAELNPEELMFGMETQRISENPLLKSFLLFAGAENTFKGEKLSNTDDGLLTAFEAQSLYLDETELVVLSACETGLGEVRNGEGVYGLQRAFIQAGAKSLIMSLWTVNDQTTQELMTEFYKQWLSGMTKREAFTKAQLQIKEKYKYPYFWGAFVMVGE